MVIRSAAACLVLTLAASCARADDDPALVYQDPPGHTQIFFLAGLCEGKTFDSNCYALLDTQQSVAAIVDPGLRTGPLMHKFLTSHRAIIQRILLTHGHEDHRGGLAWFVRETTATISLARAELELLPPELRPVDPADRAPGIPADRFQFVTDQSVLSCGRLRVEVRLTPGHTIGSVCYWLTDHGQLLTGDTLFRGQIGRTDLPLAAGRSCLLAYVRAQLLSLPDDTCVLPGHGGFSTVGQERATNPYLVPPHRVAATQSTKITKESAD